MYLYKTLQAVGFFILLSFLTACGTTTSTKPTKRLYISEILAANASTNLDPDFKQFSDWIELHNDTNETIDISGYYLSDSKKNPQKWMIPNETEIEAYGYLLLWADGQDSKKQALHTNFKLSQSGELLTLANRAGKMIDSIYFPQQEGDISCAKVSDEIVYMQPTPNSKNSDAHQTLQRTSPPTFSLKSGFYTGTQLLELYHDSGEIYYTTDGSIPTKDSTIYNGSIMIDKTTVVRARSLAEREFLSQTINHTYLINENITLPVVSIAMNEKYWDDEDIGIYTNYTKDWMRAGSVEYIKDGESKFSENVGVRLYGATSRAYPQKSISIFVKNRFGVKSIHYPLFTYKPKIQNIKSFILRNSGSDWESTMMRDALSHTLAHDIQDIDYLSYEPTIVFVNGEYYGILNLREKPNESYIQANHKLSNTPIDIIQTKATDTIINGKINSYTSLTDFIKNHSLETQDNYRYVQSQIDIKRFINYNILQQFIGNVDWPQNNIKSWKKEGIDGKWNWILYDTDMGFSLKLGNVPLTADSAHNPISRLDSPILNPNSEVLIYRKLLENEKYKNRFISTYLTLLNTVFLPKNINKHITDISSHIAQEMPRHIIKWEDDIGLNISQWRENVQRLYNYSNVRNKVMRKHLKNYFSLAGHNELTVFKPSNGDVYIDGIKINSDFCGVYFDDIAVNLEAKADKGYKFIGWSNGETTPNILLAPYDKSTIKALFSKED